MRILGMDLGATSVKAVEIDSAFRRFEVHEYHEAPRDPGSDPGEAIRRLMSAIRKPPDRVAVCLRTSQATFRNLQLPTRDRKAIQASVGFELEDDLPFPDEQAHFESVVVRQEGPGSLVHVAATLDKHMESTIATWRSGGVDPDVVTPESWALRTLLMKSPGLLDAPQSADEKPVLVLVAGHERSIAYIHWKGHPVVAREIAWGGRDITTAICRKYGIPLEQAEKTKLDNGFVLPPSHHAQATPEQVEFSDALVESVNDLVVALRQSELTCRNITRLTPSTIYLSGGASQLPGLAGFLQESLFLPVRPLRALTGISPEGASYGESSDASFALAVGAALCLVSTERGAMVNLRKGKFSRKEGGDGLRLDAFRKPALAATAVLGSMLVSLSVQKTVYGGRLRDSDAQLERSIKSLFGQISGSGVRNYLARPSELRKSVASELGKQRELSRLLGQNPRSPLAYLKELSTGVPRDVVVDLTQYQVGASPERPYSPTEEGAVSLSFLVANPQMAERLASLLGNRVSGMTRSKMEEVQVQSAPPAPGAPPNPAQDGPKTRWKITFSGKATEDAYGRQ